MGARAVPQPRGLHLHSQPSLGLFDELSGFKQYSQAQPQAHTAYYKLQQYSASVISLECLLTLQILFDFPSPLRVFSSMFNFAKFDLLKLIYF